MSSNRNIDVSGNVNFFAMAIAINMGSVKPIQHRWKSLEHN